MHETEMMRAVDAVISLPLRAIHPPDQWMRMNDRRHTVETRNRAAKRRDFLVQIQIRNRPECIGQLDALRDFFPPENDTTRHRTKRRAQDPRRHPAWKAIQAEADAAGKMTADLRQRPSASRLMRGNELLDIRDHVGESSKAKGSAPGEGDGVVGHLSLCDGVDVFAQTVSPIAL